ncbi:hypothetical protein EV2_010922 [Malus domestica]
MTRLHILKNGRIGRKLPILTKNSRENTADLKSRESVVSYRSSHSSFHNTKFGDGVVSTPLVTKEDKTPYFVSPQGISVPFSSSGNVSKGNMFMDTGTPPTLIRKIFMIVWWRK